MAIRTLDEQVDRELARRQVYGQSRHAAKQAAGGGFAVRTAGIHSRETMKTYAAALHRFAAWARDHGAGNRMSLQRCIDRYGADWLRERAESCSPWTVKMEKAALNKIAARPLDVPLPTRTPDQIKRSRGVAARDRHFSEEKNYDLCLVARATGGRRSDLAKLRKGDFFERENRLYVRFNGSKGGRDRISPVLPSREAEVRNLLKNRPDGRLFGHIHGAADVHGMRRDYARTLYEEVSQDPELRSEILQLYPPRHEPGIQGVMFHSKSGFHGLRDDIYIVSQALGHNRLDVTVSHYLQ